MTSIIMLLLAMPAAAHYDHRDTLDLHDWLLPFWPLLVVAARVCWLQVKSWLGK